MKITAPLSLTLLMLLAGAQLACAAGMDMDMSSMTSSVSAESIQAVGVVDKIDNSVATISHEAIKSLDWPAMTMNFMVMDKKLLGKLTKGQKIHFTFIRQKGKYVITDVK